jgi:hypothetical protein
MIHYTVDASTSLDVIVLSAVPAFLKVHFQLLNNLPNSTGFKPSIAPFADKQAQTFQGVYSQPLLLLFDGRNN